MAVKINIGNPFKWRRWAIGEMAPASLQYSRPAPASWFFEARYHHQGYWKVGLDYRPKDGKMPDLWHPPFMWRRAWEIEEVELQLMNSGVYGVYGVAALLGQELYGPESADLFMQQIKDYGEKAKKAKKLLFGSSEGAGAQHHEVSVPGGAALQFEQPLQINVEQHAQGLSDAAELLKYHTDPPIPFTEAVTGLQFYGLPVVIDTALFDGKVALVGMTKHAFAMNKATAAKAGNGDPTVLAKMKVKYMVHVKK